ncbi:SET domain-containing protein [Colletotrichum sublineola]|nr:SET domain-containing protein [Colletotrichum sublineola]
MPGTDDVNSACGIHSNCINRDLYIQCGDDCPSGLFFQNRHFTKKDYVAMEIINAGLKGRGVASLEDHIDGGTFTMEYVGELLPRSKFLARMREHLLNAYAAKRAIAEQYKAKEQKQQHADADTKPLPQSAKLPFRHSEAKAPISAQHLSASSQSNNRGDILSDADIHSDLDRHYYFMAITPNEILDASRKGNFSRFMNHSCDPNCILQKWVVGNELRVGFFGTRDIKKGEELCFDHKIDRYG